MIEIGWRRGVGLVCWAFKVFHHWIRVLFHCEVHSQQVVRSCQHRHKNSAFSEAARSQAIPDEQTIPNEDRNPASILDMPEEVNVEPDPGMEGNHCSLDLKQPNVGVVFFV